MHVGAFLLTITARVPQYPYDRAMRHHASKRWRISRRRGNARRDYSNRQTAPKDNILTGNFRFKFK
jgi:hypothetical protein